MAIGGKETYNEINVSLFSVEKFAKYICDNLHFFHTVKGSKFQLPKSRAISHLRAKSTVFRGTQ